MHLCVDSFVTVDRADYHGNLDAAVISGLLLCMLRSQSRLGRLYFHFS